MLICPSCKAVLKKVPESGVCPKCGNAVRDFGVETEGPHALTLGVTQEVTPPTQEFTPSDKERDTKEPTATIELPSATIELPAVGKGRSISIAPRKLSAKNVEMITNTWQAAVARGGDERSSLKIESKGSLSGGSSLVVNLRGVRSVAPERRDTSSGARPRAGADYEL